VAFMPTRIIIWGLGAMGSGIVKLAGSKKSLTIVGAIDSHHQERAGKALKDLIPEAPVGPKVYFHPEEVIKPGAADVLVLATTSFVPVNKDQILMGVRAGMNVVTIAEEMAEAHAQSPELAAEIDREAKAHKVTVLGTGINPGFVLDTLIIALTGVSFDVKRIHAARINDLSPFGGSVMRTQGVGTTPEGFEKGLQDGSIVGHIGFPESIQMIADALGWKLDRIEQTREPIISKTHRETPYVKVEPGMVAGCRQVGYGIMNGEVVITLEHPQQIHPGLEGVETGDYIDIEGTPNIHMAIKPEIPGGIGTIALAVNMIPAVMDAEPGLKNMTQMPVPRALLADVIR
jgi:4-hydroxy-tetrahydrodipicolinate reductase